MELILLDFATPTEIQMTLVRVATLASDYDLSRIILMSQPICNGILFLSQMFLINISVKNK